MSAKVIMNIIYGGVAVVGGAIGQALGGWDVAMQVLCVVMVADVLTGYICALVFKKSPKSENGAYDSKASIKGLFRKVGILLAVLIACQMDRFAGTQFIRTATITFFIANDGFSLIENLGIMGLPMPDVLKNAFEALKGKSEKTE